MAIDERGIDALAGMVADSALLNLTLRDLFALAALAGISQGSLQDREPAAARAARHAYLYADAMLAQRKEVKP